jgi:hypothetical protein
MVVSHLGHEISSLWDPAMDWISPDGHKLCFRQASTDPAAAGEFTCLCCAPPGEGPVCCSQLQYTSRGPGSGRNAQTSCTAGGGGAGGGGRGGGGGGGGGGGNASSSTPLLPLGSGAGWFDSPPRCAAEVVRLGPEAARTPDAMPPPPALCSFCSNAGSCLRHSGAPPWPRVPADAASPYYCECLLGYHGVQCQHPPAVGPPASDPCLSKPCLNGGECQTLHDAYAAAARYACTCTLAWEGYHCERPARVVAKPPSPPSPPPPAPSVVDPVVDPVHPPYSCERAGTC